MSRRRIIRIERGRDPGRDTSPAVLPPRGLPERLPAGETMLWQGAPNWRAIALHCFYVRECAIYFAALLAWSILSGNAPLVSLRLVGLAVAAICVLTVLAWLVGRTTVYTITNRRVAMQIGIALPMTLNLPFGSIDEAGLRTRADGTGDIPLTLGAGRRIGYLVLWPHARPWKFAKAQPMLRGIPEAARVSHILARALAAAAAQPAPAIPAATAAPARQPHEATA